MTNPLAVIDALVIQVVRQFLYAVGCPRGYATVDAYLEAMCVDPEWRRRWASALGRRAAVEYRRRTGREPVDAWELHGHGVRRVKAYPLHLLCFVHHEWLAYAERTGIDGEPVEWA
ncbi:hypothetical protein [Embleya sp. MST-111070]|uniref:hypothetical protein n=1 Tax=Embleya sp. MST-111070 TaxID=3398231 RepID=UPI003F736D33